MAWILLGKITNFVLQEIDLHYHIHSGQMSTALDDLSTCNIKEGFCPLLQVSYIWNYTKETKGQYTCNLGHDFAAVARFCGVPIHTRKYTACVGAASGITA